MKFDESKFIKLNRSIFGLASFFATWVFLVLMYYFFVYIIFKNITRTFPTLRTLILLMFIALPILYVVKWLMTQYYYGDGTLITKTLFRLKRSPHVDSRNLEVKQGIWQKIWNYGTITIGSPEEGAGFVLPYIKDPFGIPDRVKALEEKLALEAENQNPVSGMGATGAGGAPGGVGMAGVGGNDGMVGEAVAVGSAVAVGVAAGQQSLGNQPTQTVVIMNGHPVPLTQGQMNGQQNPQYPQAQGQAYGQNQGQVQTGQSDMQYSQGQAQSVGQPYGQTSQAGVQSVAIDDTYSKPLPVDVDENGDFDIVIEEPKPKPAPVQYVPVEINPVISNTSTGSYGQDANVQNPEVRKTDSQSQPQQTYSDMNFPSTQETYVPQVQSTQSQSAQSQSTESQETKNEDQPKDLPEPKKETTSTEVRPGVNRIKL